MRCTFKNFTASGQISAGGCVLDGFFVNSLSSGTMVLFHGTTAANTGRIYSTAEITPASVGWYSLGGLDFTAGAYVNIGTVGTLNVTFAIREVD